MGLKRASPGAEEHKEPLTANLSEEDAEKLTAIRREMAKIELYIGMYQTFSDAEKCF